MAELESGLKRKKVEVRIPCLTLPRLFWDTVLNGIMIELLLRCRNCPMDMRWVDNSAL